MKTFLCIVGLCLLTVPNNAHGDIWSWFTDEKSTSAPGTPKFGAEFTFKPIGRDPLWGNRSKVRQAYSDYCLNIPDCRYSRGYVYNTKSDFWFYVDRDITVIEIGTKPATVEELKANADWMQRHLFDFMQASQGVNHSAALSGGGGHVSMDQASSFKTTPLALYNAYTSFANYPIISEYIFGLRYNWNARAVSALKTSARQNVQQVLADYRANPEAFTFETLHEKLNQAQQSGGAGRAAFNEKSHAMTLKKNVYEFRGHLPQLNAQQFIDQVSFYQAWVDWINKQTTPIAEKIPDRVPRLEPDQVRAQWTEFLNLIGANTPQFQQIYVMDMQSCDSVAAWQQRITSLAPPTP